MLIVYYVTCLLHSQLPPSGSQPAARRQRPLSQPVQFGINPSVFSSGEGQPRRIPMPEISEFSPQGTQYASSSSKFRFSMWSLKSFNFAIVLDEVGSKEDAPAGESTLKTRSLPAWVRSKPRPLSTEDDLNDLYAKVSNCGGCILCYMVLIF